MDSTDIAPSDVPPLHWWVVKVVGDLDICTGPDFEAQMGRAMAQHHDDGFVLDLSAVTFMDCAALRPVLRLRDQLRQRLCLRPVPARVLRLLELTDVARGLRILTDGEQWPAEADPDRRGSILDDLADRHPYLHGSALAGTVAAASPEKVQSMTTVQPMTTVQSMSTVQSTEAGRPLEPAHPMVEAQSTEPITAAGQ